MNNPQDLVGRRIEQYELQKHIARGGMADVYLAYDHRLERRAAVKIMLPALAADEQYAQRFQREARTVAQLDDPNIVHVYNIGTTEDGRPYIAMQYVEGGSLRDTIEQLAARGQRLEASQVLGIAGRMADALQVAHRLNIVHRDLKPSNILLREDGRPVLVDLGIAAVSGGPKLTHTGTLIGTPHYMSPEQARGEPLDGRADLYSLGIILYELFAGRRPFEGQDMMAVLHQQVYEEPVPLENLRPDLSPATHYLVMRALQKDRNRRFQSAAEMRTAINEAIRAEGGPGVLLPDGTWQPYPTGAYRLSDSKIVPPQTPTPHEPVTAQKEGSSKVWIAAVVALLLFAGGFAIWQLVLAPDADNGSSGDDVIVVAPTEDELPGVIPTIDSPVVTDTPVEEPTATTPADESVPQPTATFAPLPTFTPQPSPEPTATPEATATPEPSPTAELGWEQFEIGRSVRGQPIEALRFGNGSRAVIFIGGLHAGFAPGTVSIADAAIGYFENNLARVPESISLYIIPNASPDSPFAPGELRGRLNANSVDLNRNWDCDWTRDALFRNAPVSGSGGSAPFSEPESVALRDFITGQDPEAVVFWEARAANGLSTPGACDGPPRVSQDLANVYGRAAGYPVDDFEDLTSQVLNGDASNWLDDQGIPAIAILLPDYETTDWNNNLAGILAVLDRYQ